jgi:hypothetical protein
VGPDNLAVRPASHGIDGRLTCHLLGATGDERSMLRFGNISRRIGSFTASLTPRLFLLTQCT